MKAIGHMILAVSSNVGILILPPVGGKVEKGPQEKAKETEKNQCPMPLEWQLEGAGPSRMYWDRFKVPRISHVHKYAVQIMNIKYLAEPGIR